MKGANQFSKDEAQKRFEAALNISAKPLKSMTPKQPKAQPTKAKKEPAKQGEPVHC